MSANQIGPFEILRTLGRIDEKRVFKAASTADGKMVAVRPIQGGGERTPALIEVARRAMALESPNIVQVQEVTESDGESYVVTEYVEGNDLRSVLKEDAGISVWDATDIARQICSAIDHARLRHLAHRNLTPANIMIEWDGTVKVMDYETLTDPSESYRAGRNPEALHYLSPEQARGEGPDWRSNLFSLGAILYELLTGKKAFPGEDAREILENITGKDPKAPHLVKATLNPGLSRVIMKSLSKKPEERYQSGTELIRDFENHRKPVAESAPVAAKPANSIRSSEGRLKLSPADASSNVVKQPTIDAPRTKVSIAIKPLQSYPPPSNEKPAVAVMPASSTVTSVPISVRSISQPMVARLDSEELPAENSRTAVTALKPRIKPLQSSLAFVARHKAVLLYAVAGVLLLVASFGLGRGVGDVIRAYVRPSQPITPATEQAQAIPAASTGGEVNAVQDNTQVVRSGRQLGRKRSAPVMMAAPALMVGELIIDSSPQGATIQLDGQGTLSFQTPYTAVSLSVGRHTVGLSKPGYATESRTIEIAAGQKSRLLIAMTELGATVSIASDPPGAAVFIDGQDTGRTTPVAVVLKKGSHTLNLRKAGYLQVATKVELAGGQSLQYTPHLLPTGNEDDIKAVGKLGRILGRHSRNSMATLQIRSDPKGARIIVNQRVLDKTTPAEFSVPEGSYEIALALDGYSRVQRTISVVAGSNFVVDEKLEK
ncbi:MAG: serine/threonine-protein kinase [Candidatus Korobacteraceae bacterium]